MTLKPKCLFIAFIVIFTGFFIKAKVYALPSDPYPDYPHMPNSITEIEARQKQLEENQANMLNNQESIKKFQDQLAVLQNSQQNMSNEQKDIFKGQKEISDSIFDLPGKLTDKIIEFLFKPVADWFDSDIQLKVNQMNYNINYFYKILTQEDLDSNEFQFAINLWSQIKPIGYSLLALFFTVSFCKKAMYFEMMNDIEVYKTLIKFVFAKVLVDKSYELLSMIVKINKSIVNIIFDTLRSANNTEVIKYVNSNVKIDVMQKIMNGFKTTWFMVFLGLCLIICTVMVVIRKIEMAVLTSVSPIFFSTFSGESTSDVFKNFIKNYISVTAQTIWIAVGVAFLMNSYISSVNIDSTGILDGSNFIVGVVALTIYCIQAPSSVRNAIGGAGGGGLSLSSLVHLVR